ncbi:PIN domain-containing protein [Parabacteroides sp.]|uniref:type II toxin-antitoxin system VapC family toxin n=1 Tax=Parabacteroides sp. TaxID=1869337 RepID=UPI00257B1488|nr:PIN domain-containing protein [Parabacteroides sp.]
MKPKIFLDTNIIIDIIGNRQPYSIAAANILGLAQKGSLELYATALTFANALYILRRELGTEKATNYLRNLGKLVFIAPTTQLEVDKAFQSINPDFEDAIQYFSAQSVGANVIITRNQKHFRYSEIPVMDADEFMKG